MIGKLMIIEETGLLPYYFSQDEINIDTMLLSGFCRAIYSIAKELHDEIDMILMKKRYKILFGEFMHDTGKKYLVAALCEKYHIDEAVLNKLELIFKKYFRSREIDPNVLIKSPKLDTEISDILNDAFLAKLVEKKKDKIEKLLKPVIDNEDNRIYAYLLTSSGNNILLYGYNKKILEHHGGKEPKEIIIDYLKAWDIKKIPQGDMFEGHEHVCGLDPVDFYYTEEKMLGLCINTAVNCKEEPKNELLLYFFGKHPLMRQIVLGIEQKLSEILMSSD